MLLLLALLGCGPTGPRADEAAAASMAHTFCTMLKGVEQECTRSGATAATLGHEFTFSVVRDKELTVAGQTTAELTINVAMDGQPLPMEVVVTATGPGETGPGEKAANDWGSIFGAPLADRYLSRGELVVLQSLQDKQRPPPAFDQSGWTAYPGWPYLVGQQKERATLMLGPLLQTLEPTLSSWDKSPEAIHTALVSLTFRPGYAPDLQCRVDGAPSQTLCEQALTYPWPEPGAGGYVIKQFFVFSPGSP